MKLKIETPCLRLRHPFTISRGSQEVVKTVIASLEGEGITGLGEASPNLYYGHTVESVAAALKQAVPLLLKADPFRYRHLLEALLEKLNGNRTALCALDLALFDWIGKKLGLPLYRLFGLDPALAPVSSFTIGISSTDHMQAKARESADFPVLKVKLGTDRDLEIIRALREVTTSARFRVDANGAWTAQEAIDKSRELAALGVELIEQPLPPEELDAMEEVYRKSALPLIADENAVVPEDVPRVAGRFHGINIKLVKCGGLLPALQMVELASAHQLKVMVGCMIESSVGISGGAHMAPLVDYVDLDGALLTENDPYEGVEIDKGRLLYPNRPGLGVVPRG